MEELYEYIKGKLDEMYKSQESTITIDMNHAFRLYHNICYMKQIKSIIQFQEDIYDDNKGRDGEVR